MRLRYFMVFPATIGIISSIFGLTAQLYGNRFIEAFFTFSLMCIAFMGGILVTSFIIRDTMKKFEEVIQK